MSDNFTIGSAPINEPNLAKLDFHQYEIYKRDWPSGTLKFDAVTGNFYILPDVQKLSDLKN